MQRTAKRQSALLIEWSPSRVRVLDPITGQSTHGATIAKCIVGTQKGRDVVIAVSQRSAFIRALKVPNLSKDELSKVLDLNLRPTLPLDLTQYVLGFRLATDVNGKGRIAIIGAVKADSVRRIHGEAKANGLRVRAVLPLAFASWLAARARMLTSCAVVTVDGEVCNIDLVVSGELCYSRSIPLPETGEEVGDEVARTFVIAEVSSLPVLSTGASKVLADFRDEKDPIEYLADIHAIDKLLFSMDVPEKKDAQRAKKRSRAALRAICAAGVALVLGAYVNANRYAAQPKLAADKARLQEILQSARSARSAAVLREADVAQAGRLLDIAFRPAQTFTDIVTALGDSVATTSWVTGLTLERGRPVVIKGQAVHNKEIADLFGGLSKNPRFQGVKLVSDTKGAIGKVPVVQFAIEGYPSGSLAIRWSPKGGR